MTAFTTNQRVDAGLIDLTAPENAESQARRSSADDVTTRRPAPTPSRDAQRRKVLVIASRFPPVASVGAIRIRKFAKYLREFGWEPIVITGAMRADTQNSHDARRAIEEAATRSGDALTTCPPLGPPAGWGVRDRVGLGECHGVTPG